MENLLDDKNIEGELPSSFLTEIKGMGKWILITATMGIIVGGVLGMVSFFSVSYAFFGVIEMLVALAMTILAVLLFYFAYVQFRYARILKWLEVDSTTHTLDDFIQYTHRVWRLFAVTALLTAVLLILMTYISLVPASMVAPPSVPSQEPVFTEPMSPPPITIDTTRARTID